MTTEASSNNAIEKLAEAMARRAVVVRQSPKSAMFANQLGESDVLCRYGQQALGTEKQANQFTDALQQGVGGVKGWWNNLGADNQQAVRNAGIGLGGGALLGGAMNMLGTDKDDERRHPFSSALTGALAGGAIGGLGTLGWQHFNKARNASPETDALQEQQDLHDDATRSTLENIAGGPAAMNRSADGIPSAASEWRGDFEDATGLSPETVSRAAGTGWATGSVLNDLQHNRNLRYGQGIQNWLKANPGAPLPPGVTTEMLNNPRIQSQLQRAGTFNRGWSPQPGTTVNAQTVRDFNQAVRQQAGMGSAPSGLRGLRGSALRAGVPGASLFFAPEIADAAGGWLMNDMQSDDARQRLQWLQAQQGN